MKYPLQYLQNKEFVQHHFCLSKVLHVDVGDELLDHINKVKPLVDQLACLEVPMWEEDIIMTLLESLPTLYKYLITALEMLPMKELAMEYVMPRLIHEMSKHKEEEPQSKDVAMVSHQSKASNSPL